MVGARGRGVSWLGIQQLRHYRGLTLLATIGVAIAVLSLVVFVSLGTGVVGEGETEIKAIGGDLWVTAGPTTIGPTTIGHVEHSLTDAHDRTAALRARDDIQAARAFTFQSVYASADADEFETITAAGVTGDGSIFSTVEGETLTGGDTHYAGGNYDGPMVGEVLLDERAAAQLGVDVGDSIHIGGTFRAAEEQSFVVQGISNDITKLVGTPTIVLHLGELQRVTQSTHADPATAIIIAVDDAEPQTVKSDLAEAYPELTIRTNHEQFQTVLQRQSVILAGAGTLIALGIASGAAIVANVFGLLVASQRSSLMAIRALGVSRGTLLGIVGIQGLLIGILGTIVGFLLAVPAIWSINYLVAETVGFSDIVTLELSMLPIGAGIAIGTGILGAVVAGWWLGGTHAFTEPQP